MRLNRFFHSLDSASVELCEKRECLLFYGKMLQLVKAKVRDDRYQVASLPPPRRLKTVYRDVWNLSEWRQLFSSKDRNKYMRKMRMLTWYRLIIVGRFERCCLLLLYVEEAAQPFHYDLWFRWKFRLPFATLCNRSFSFHVISAKQSKFSVSADNERSKTMIQLVWSNLHRLPRRQCENFPHIFPLPQPGGCRRKAQLLRRAEKW